MNFKPHTNCRVCNTPLEKRPYIDLGKLPLSNNLLTTAMDKSERYPLQVVLCDNCGLSQLSIVVDPKILFSRYVYRSSISKGYVNHCRMMAIKLKERYGFTSASSMIDIAGNDGALLKEFKREIGLKILNVDPAENLSTISRTAGIPMLNAFWSLETAKRIHNGSGYGKVDLITATNVIAHVDDITDFMKGIKLILTPGGVCILEFPYLIDFIENGEFDTIYFEHLSYMSIKPLKLLCEKVGLKITDIEKFDIHGGSLRVHIRHDHLHEMISKENELTYDVYKEFSRKAVESVKNFYKGIYELKRDGNSIAAFAASAKGNTLLNTAMIDWGFINYIVDETPEKIGCYSPGTQIPIVSMLELKENPPSYLVILSWNFADEIIEKCLAAGYQGKFIIPIPEFKIIQNEHRAKSSNCLEY